MSGNDSDVWPVHITPLLPSAQRTSAGVSLCGNTSFLWVAAKGPGKRPASQSAKKLMH